MVFWERQNYGTVKRSVVARDCWGEGINQQSREDF